MFGNNGGHSALKKSQTVKSPALLNTYIKVHRLMRFPQNSPEMYLWKTSRTTRCYHH